jgi:methyl-accepting chemotaxis protein
MPKLSSMHLVVGVLGAQIIVLALLAGTGLWTGLSLASQLQSQEQSHGAIVQVRVFETQLVSVDAAITQYLSTPDSAELRSLEKRFVEAQARSEMLAEQALGKSLPPLDRIVDSVRRWTEQSRAAARIMSVTGELGQARSALFSALKDYSAEVERLMVVRRAEADRATHHNLILQAVLVIVAVGLALFVCLVFYKVLVQPLRAIAARTLALADGAYDNPIDQGQRLRELVDLSSALTTFRENLIERQRLRETAERDAEALERRQIAVEDAIGDFRQVVGAILETLGRHAQQTRLSAQTLAEVTGAASRESSDAASASQQISSNAVAVASAVEQLAAGAIDIANQSQTSYSKVADMAEGALATETTMRQLAIAAEKIGMVSGMIKAVADQTNLLSLNATIEAARAGAAGRGFAVVAAEVKTLAGQASSSANEIDLLVASIQNHTSAAVNSIAMMARLAHEAQQASKVISSAIREQHDVTSEISRSFQETSQGATFLATNIRNIANVVSDTNASSLNSLTLSEDLTKNAAQLRMTVDRFLTQVKAA